MIRKKTTTKKLLKTLSQSCVLEPILHWQHVTWLPRAVGGTLARNQAQAPVCEKPDKVAVMTRFQQIAQQPTRHFGELSTSRSKKDCLGT